MTLQQWRCHEAAPLVQQQLQQVRWHIRMRTAFQLRLPFLMTRWTMTLQQQLQQLQWHPSMTTASQLRLPWSLNTPA